VWRWAGRTSAGAKSIMHELLLRSLAIETPRPRPRPEALTVICVPSCAFTSLQDPRYVDDIDDSSARHVALRHGAATQAASVPSERRSRLCRRQSGILYEVTRKTGADQQSEPRGVGAAGVSLARD